MEPVNPPTTENHQQPDTIVISIVATRIQNSNRYSLQNSVIADGEQKDVTLAVAIAGELPISLLSEPRNFLQQQQLSQEVTRLSNQLEQQVAVYVWEDVYGRMAGLAERIEELAAQIGNPSGDVIQIPAKQLPSPAEA